MRDIDEFVERTILAKKIESAEYEVEHYFIDWRPMNLHEKIRTFQENKTSAGLSHVNIDDFKIADIICKIVQKVGSEIDGDTVVKDIIDY